MIKSTKLIFIETRYMSSFIYMIMDAHLCYVVFVYICLTVEDSIIKK